MKVFISFDYEGLGGVAFWKETLGDARWNAEATEQVNAFVEGVVERHPDAEIVVCDSHTVGDNLDWGSLHPSVRIVRGYPRRHYMVEGLDRSFTNLVLFGYHAAVGLPGMMDHTYSSAAISRIAINGVDVDEGLLNSWYAGELGVPLSFVFGDDACVEGVARYAPGVAVLASKRAIARFAGEMLPKARVLEALRAAGKALEPGSGRILATAAPVKVVVRLANTLLAYAAAIVPGVEAISGTEVAWTASSMEECYRYLQTVVFVCGAVKDIK